MDAGVLDAALEGLRLVFSWPYILYPLAALIIFFGVALAMAALLGCGAFAVRSLSNRHEAQAFWLASLRRDAGPRSSRGRASQAAE